AVRELDGDFGQRTLNRGGVGSPYPPLPHPGNQWRELPIAGCQTPSQARIQDVISLPERATSRYEVTNLTPHFSASQRLTVHPPPTTNPSLTLVALALRLADLLGGA